MGDNTKQDNLENEMKDSIDTSLALVQNNAELAAMYNESASLGSQNLSGELPMLKIHATGRSTKNELADGSEPADGSFFYKPTQEQFSELKVHILTISRGFRAPALEEGKPDVFNQMVGGVIIDGTELKPFVFYVTGLKLANLWEFGKSIRKYTKAKPVSIPMFALTVKLTTEKVKHSKGNAWIVNFELEKDEKGNPIIVTDMGEFQFLKEHVTQLEETIESIIQNKSTQDEFDTPVEGVAEPLDPEKINEDDIPF